MNLEKIEISVMLPRMLWDELSQQAKSEHEQEMNLLIRAIEQYLGHETPIFETFSPEIHGLLSKPSQQKTRAMGKYAFVPSDTESFMALKQSDIELEG